MSNALFQDICGYKSINSTHPSLNQTDFYFSKLSLQQQEIIAINLVPILLPQFALLPSRNFSEKIGFSSNV